MKIPATSMLLTCLMSGSAVSAQQAPFNPDDARHLAGMWSDPSGFLGAACFNFCTDASLEKFFALLDDPANDDTPLQVINAMSRAQTIEAEIRSRLTDFSRADFPRRGEDDPAFLECKPPGLGKEIYTPHQNELILFDDRIEIHHAEWDVRRTVWMDGRSPPANLDKSLYGFSVGHMEGPELVVNTSHLLAGIIANLMSHSDQLTIEERISVSEDGQQMITYFTYTDPVALQSPLTLKKVRDWAPDEQIFPYDSCEIPTDYIENQREQP
jgi:hypothetical protein